MVLYRSPEQTDLHTYISVEVFLYRYIGKISPVHIAAMFFEES